MSSFTDYEFVHLSDVNASIMTEIERLANGNERSGKEL